MKNSKEEIDQLINEALSKEEAEFYHRLEKEETVYQMITGLYSGAFKWPAVISVTVSLIFLAVGAYAVFRFFETEVLKEMLMWFGVFMFSCLTVLMNKLLHWTRISVNTLQREIKRLELQVAVLAKSLKKENG